MALNVIGEPQEIPAAAVVEPALEKPLSAPERFELLLTVSAPPVRDWRGVKTETCIDAALARSRSERRILAAR